MLQLLPLLRLQEISDVTIIELTALKVTTLKMKMLLMVVTVTMMKLPSRTTLLAIAVLKTLTC